MDKISKENIKRLKKDKKYDEIFVKYGIKAYKKYVPLRYRIQDQIKLQEEGKYEDIYNKYGKEEYSRILTKAMYDDIKQERGIGKAIIWRIKSGIAKTDKKVGIISSLSFLSLSSMIVNTSEGAINENAKQYKNEINEYNENISDYAKNVKAMNLSDTQIFMKVMDDMWKNIKGYAEPEKDIHGFLELDLATKDGYGVCRNMASDIAKKLNEINHNYNARTMFVKMGNQGDYEISDIHRNIYETNQTIVEECEQSEENEKKDKLIQNIVGNHMVTLVDVQKDNLTIVLDPTNPAIGIYYEGKIIMLNSKGKDFEAKEYFNAIMNGYEGVVNTVGGYIDSYKKPNLSFEEIEQKYGLKAQNKALKEVRAMDIANKTIEENDFLNSLKVEVSNNIVQKENHHENERIKKDVGREF